MKTFTEIIGNIHSDPIWHEKLKQATIEYVDLDQWTAQKSRFIAQSDHGITYGVALQRQHSLENGDILEYDIDKNQALIIRIELKPVLIIHLNQLLQYSPDEILRQGIELGHALGNQHWPAIIKGDKVYVPLTVDKKVMQSVMDTHHFESITYEFQDGEEVIPYLAPHEIRKLFGGASQSHTHHHDTH